MKTYVSMIALSFLALLLGTRGGEEGAAEAGRDRPNIVFILTDDTGWNGLSIQADPEIPGSGSMFYQTPNTDRLALSGIRFSMAYSPSPTCGPSRTSIQYGLSPSTVGKFAEEVPRHLPPMGDAMVMRLKAAFPQYKAAHFGKWHQRTRSPEEIGYDESDGPTFNLQTQDPEDPKHTFSLARKAKDFIVRQADAKTPFFLQVSFYANHLKYDALPETIARYEARADKATEYQNDPIWAAMNEDLDTGVGTILGTLEALGIRDNTYIIYTADNGFECKRDSAKPLAERGFHKAYPIRSHKYMVSEGGLRVPFLVSGPGIPAGKSSREPVVGWDILPTVLDMAGAGHQIPKAVEGGSLLEHCVSGGREKVVRRDPFMVFRYTKRAGRRDIAIVQDGYKLLRELDNGEEHLFSLWDDLGESRNLLEKMPERADQLRQNMEDYFAAIGWDQNEHEGYRAEQIDRRQANKKNKDRKKKEKRMSGTRPGVSESGTWATSRSSPTDSADEAQLRRINPSC